MNAAKGYHHAILQKNVSVSLLIYILLSLQMKGGFQFVTKVKRSMFPHFIFITCTHVSHS